MRLKEPCKAYNLLASKNRVSVKKNIFSIGTKAFFIGKSYFLTKEVVGFVFSTIALPRAVIASQEIRC